MASSNLISCNFSTLSPPKLSDPKPRNSLLLRPPHSLLSPRASISGLSTFLGRANSALPLRQKGRSEIFRRASNSESNDGDSVSEIDSEKKILNLSVGDGSKWSDWTTSGFLFLIWAGLMYYFWVLSPNQTPSRDMYFATKLTFLVRNDGFRMNQVLVGLWNIMGVWPLVYAQLLMPSGRSSRSKVKVWPFVLLSCAGGVYALFPYFVFWRPPPPPVEEAELTRWPLNFLESKITAAVSLVAGVGLLTYAGLASGADWKEFYQYFRESRFVNVTTLDFILISALAPFWVYNDMTARKSSDKDSWLLPLSVIPFLGPALYILLRPPITTIPESLSSSTASDPK